jgi:hypothetical protein
MQVQSHPTFQDSLFSIGESATGNYVEIPDSMVIMGDSREGLIHDIFGDEQILTKGSFLLPNMITHRWEQ